MAYYRLYCISDDGHIFYCHELHADDDIDAIKQARQIQSGTAAELWQEDRKIHTFELPVH